MRRAWLVLTALALALTLNACTYRVTTPPGTQTSSVTPQGRACLGIILQDTRSGLNVVKVLPGSPAAAAHLSPYETRYILGFAGHEVSTVAQVNRIEAELAPGTLVDVTYSGFLNAVHRVYLHLGQWDHETCVPVVNGP